MKTDTPRTDAIGIDHLTATVETYRFRKLSRTLERENAKLREVAAGCSDAWLQERAIFFRTRAEERPHEFSEYRRMAWACEFVREIWREANVQALSRLGRQWIGLNGKGFITNRHLKHHGPSR